MTLRYVRHPLTSSGACFTLLAFVASACGGTSQPDLPVNVIDLTDGGVGVGCSQPAFPAAEPDLFPLDPPEFVDDSGAIEELVRPGQELRAEIPVSAETRQITVELSNAWADEIIAQQVLDTTGNELVPVAFVTPQQKIGRYYMRISLCGTDCAEREVVFDIIPPDALNPAETGINGNFERTVIENGEVVRVDQTCVRPNSVLIQ